MRVVLDIETTGLDPDRYLILEVGAIAINDDLTERPAGNWPSRFSTVVNHPGAYELAGDYVRDMHTKNGLWDDVRNSTLSRHDLDERLRDWLRAFGASKEDLVILCGHTIDFDHKFVCKHLPLAAELLHYRKDDFGAVGRFAREVCGFEFECHRKEEYTHRGLADCLLELDDARKFRELLRSR